MTAGFAAIFIQRQNLLSNVSLTYGLIFLALCLGAHIVLRLTLPSADPYLFPLVALLACFGLVMVYRIDDTLARQQAQWFVIGLILFAATIVFLRDYLLLERYRYVIALGSLFLLLLPRVPGIGSQVNGAYLGIHFAGTTFQPAEFAKIGIVVFLASYLRDTRQLLVTAGRRFLGVTLPPLKHFGPLLVVFGAAMLELLVIRDLGSSLMFFGGFLAVLYVATNRLSFPLIGLVLFALGAWLIGTHTPHVHDRILAWQHPFRASLYNRTGGSFQVAQSVFAQADGGLFGRGFGEALISYPCQIGGHNATCPLLPARADRPDLLGHHQRARAVRRLRAAARLPAGGRARLPDRHAGARLVLEAARHRPDRGLRAAGVRDRRRRHARDPADRRDAAVRVLRRLVDHGELRPAGAAAARVRQAPGGTPL